MRRAPLLALVLAFGLLAPACKQLGLAPREVDETVVREDPGAREPRSVVVQHVLIAHAGAELPGVTRTLPEAERLAEDVLRQARAGTSFDELVRLYGDDRSDGGVLTITNYGVPRGDADSVERSNLVRAFGAAAFRLEVGEIDVVAYDADGSPFGYHVITRLQ